jgi:hypothetical protein
MASCAKSVYESAGFRTYSTHAGRSASGAETDDHQAILARVRCELGEEFEVIGTAVMERRPSTLSPGSIPTCW